MTEELTNDSDVGNKWVIPSCAGGNCLRSHVNKTETRDALVMLTKAGVSSQKIVVGISSYGRSFRMADTSCSGPFCKFTGDNRHSMAYLGECTATAGYISNAEINMIIEDPGQYSIIKTSVDTVSASNILMYGVPGAVDWVAYMDGNQKSDRIKWIKGLNFGGTTDWAVDLQTMDYDENDGEDEDEDEEVLPNGCPASANPGNLQGLANNAGSMENNCASLYGLDILYKELIDALALFKVNSQDYDDKYGWYVRWTKEQIQPRLDQFVSIGSGKGSGKETSTNCANMLPSGDEDTSWRIRYQVDDENGFFDELQAQYGIEKSWVVWGDRVEPFHCAINDDVRPLGGGTFKSCPKVIWKWENVPKKAADSDIHIGNPKDLIEASMAISYLDVGLTFYDDGDDGGNPLDAVVAYSMLIFQMTEAISSMKDIKEIGEQAREDAKRDLIFKILTIVFMVIPFVGEAIGPIVGSAAAVARIALLFGEAGNAALTVADIIEDPSSAPFAILGLVAGASAGRSTALEKASAARGLLKDSDMAKFPQRFRDKDALVQKIAQKVCAI
ncbi:hypothetical protein DL95DRAFT_498048 [Leptodontidium sp. 2 PMI_412]|nr:hypothetical protein DL95DRAFT_498048 [Leptodontidium sp. 2 PMI_412]